MLAGEDGLAVLPERAQDRGQLDDLGSGAEDDGDLSGGVLSHDGLLLVLRACRTGRRKRQPRTASAAALSGAAGPGRASVGTVLALAPHVTVPTLTAATAPERRFTVRAVTWVLPAPEGVLVDRRASCATPGTVTLDPAAGAEVSVWVARPETYTFAFTSFTAPVVAPADVALQEASTASALSTVPGTRVICTPPVPPPFTVHVPSEPTVTLPPVPTSPAQARRNRPRRRSPSARRPRR